MGYGTAVIGIPFSIVALAALVLAIAAWRRERSPGSLSFMLMMLAVAIWVAAAALEAITQSNNEKILWAKVAYLGIAWVSVFWLLFTLEYTAPERQYTQRLLPWLAFIPTVTIALVLTNEQHSLIWSTIRSVGQPGSFSLVYAHGPWFIIFTVFSYLLLLIGGVVLVRAMGRRSGTQHSQVVALMSGMLIPWLANILYLSGSNPWPGLDLTPYAFSLTGIIYAWTLFRLGLFDLSPLAHKAILERITDGFLVLDTRGRVVEINALARQFLGLAADQAAGKPARDMINQWPTLAEMLNKPGSGTIELAVTLADQGVRCLEVSLTDWFQYGRRFAGRILILRDITWRKKAEENLSASERLYRQLVNTAPVGIVLTDLKGNLTFVSPTVYDLYQISRERPATGQSPLNWIHADDRAIASTRILKVIEDQENLPSQEYRLVRADGSTFWGEITSSPLLGENGSVTGVLAIVRDISSRKELELRLKHNLEHQTFINGLLQILYRPKDIKEALVQVLERAGRFEEASRVYLCKDSADGQETTILLEWCQPDIHPRARESVLVRYAAIPSWKQNMEQGGLILAPTADSMPEDICEYMATWEALSLAAFPIYGAEERLYGFLAYEHCGMERDWSQEDQELLWSICRIVSGAVAKMQAEEAERHQRTLAEALHDTASALNSTLNLEEVLDRILANLEIVVPKVAANIAMVDEDGTLRFVRWRGYDAAGEEFLRTLREPLSEGPTYMWMAETGEPAIISDTWLDKRWLVHEPNAWIRSYAGAPIRIKGKTQGFINLDSGEPDTFTPNLSYSLHVFADQAAIAIENARLYDAVHHRAEEMSILYRIGLTLTTGREMGNILISLFDECRQVLPIDMFSVAIYEPGTGQIEVPLYYNQGEYEEIAPRDILTQPGLTGEVIRQRRTIYLPDTLSGTVEQDYKIERHDNPPARSYVGVPLILLDKVVGVIAMEKLEAHAYTYEQISLLETIATQAAIAVQNMRLYDQMKQMAITDSVTGLFSRRHFSDLGRSEVERALRYDRSLSVLMVDIDHFKRVNDSFGHNAGDQVLQKVAQVCSQALRATDIVGRWGGEEFVIALPEADREGAALIGERIRRMMAETEMHITHQSLRVTISIGVATLRRSGMSLEALIDAADQALYLAKQSGRNQVRFMERVA